MAGMANPLQRRKCWEKHLLGLAAPFRSSVLPPGSPNLRTALEHFPSRQFPRYSEGNRISHADAGCPGDEDRFGYSDDHATYYHSAPEHLDKRYCNAHGIHDRSPGSMPAMLRLSPRSVLVSTQSYPFQEGLIPSTKVVREDIDKCIER